MPATKTHLLKTRKRIVTICGLLLLVVVVLATVSLGHYGNSEA